MDYQSFGAVGRLLFVASVVVTVINAIWRHGDIDLTGKHANLRTLYLRSIILGVVVAALARINVVAMLRDEAAFDSWINVPEISLFDDAVGILITGIVIAFLSKVWNDVFDVLYEFKRWLRGKANALRPDEGAVRIREGRESGGGGGREMRRGRRGGSRGGRPMGSGLGMGGDRAIATTTATASVTVTGTAAATVIAAASVAASARFVVPRFRASPALRRELRRPIHHARARRRDHRLDDSFAIDLHAPKRPGPYPPGPRVYGDGDILGCARPRRAAATISHRRLAFCGR